MKDWPGTPFPFSAEELLSAAARLRNPLFQVCDPPKGAPSVKGMSDELLPRNREDRNAAATLLEAIAQWRVENQ